MLPPELLRRDFVVNFATYTRAYTVSVIHYFFAVCSPLVARDWIRSTAVCYLTLPECQMPTLLCSVCALHIAFLSHSGRDGTLVLNHSRLID